MAMHTKRLVHKSSNTTRGNCMQAIADRANCASSDRSIEMHLALEKESLTFIKESDGIASRPGEAWAPHLHSGNFEWTGFNGTVKKQSFRSKVICFLI